MTVTKTQLADAYSKALTEELGDEWDCDFSRRDASRFLDILWPVVSELALKDTKKRTPGSVPLGHLGRLKMRYKAPTKARKGTNPFTGEADHVQGQARNAAAALHRWEGIQGRGQQALQEDAVGP